MNGNEPLPRVRTITIHSGSGGRYTFQLYEDGKQKHIFRMNQLDTRILCELVQMWLDKEYIDAVIAERNRKD
jgi:hypothetical protein